MNSTTPDDEYGWLDKLLADFAAIVVTLDDDALDTATNRQKQQIISRIQQNYTRNSEVVEKERRAYKQGWDSAGGENIFTRSEVERVKREAEQNGAAYAIHTLANHKAVDGKKTIRVDWLITKGELYAIELVKIAQRNDFKVEGYVPQLSNNENKDKAA
ncbi:hypothetical protein [Gordonia terrae]|uniref:hypothetical protein n=1 Tax=Gordonia terrae TaxID=2055 RepID=UPI00126977F1|nr:hypothetical protein [Gordonia terrae]